MLRIRIDGVSATVVENETLTAGRVGLECAFEFAGGDWGDLLKVAVFEGVETVDVALVGGSCIVPWEAMQVEGVQLKVGVYGANGAGTIVIPTVWAKVGKIQPSANPSGNVPDTPSQNLIAYAVETANDAEAVALSVKARADNGDFDGEDGQDGEDGADGSQLWKSSAAPTSAGGTYTFDASDLSGDPDMSPAVGDIVFYSYYYYNVTSVSGTSVICASRVSIRGSSGANGQGVPTGGTTGQVLKKLSGTDYDTYWDDESGGGGGTSDYDDLTDKPQINSVTLSGNKSASDLGLDQVFWAVQGSTHNDAIHAAHDAGKVVLAEISGRVYQMTEEVSSNEHVFTCSDKDTVYWVTVKNNLWDLAPTSKTIPSAATATPSNLGTAAVGSSAKYAKEDHVHENNIFAVTYTKTDATTATCDKTFADIVAAATAGKTVVAVLSGLFPASQTADISITSATSFNVTAPIGGTGSITISHNSADVISFSQVYGQEEITASGILKGNGAGGVSAAVAGTDYIAPPGSPSAGDVLTYSSGAWAAAAPAHQIPAGGNAGECLAKNSASDYDLRWRTINDWTPAGLIRTNGGTAAKVAEWSFWDDTHYPQILYITLGLANTAASALTLKVNGKGPYPIYIDGAASSSTNYTLPAGSYLVYFDGTNFYFDTTGKIPSAMLPVYNGGVS